MFKFFCEKCGWLFTSEDKDMVKIAKKEHRKSSINPAASFSKKIPTMVREACPIAPVDLLDGYRVIARPSLAVAISEALRAQE